MTAFRYPYSWLFILVNCWCWKVSDSSTFVALYKSDEEQRFLWSSSESLRFRYKYARRIAASASVGWHMRARLSSPDKHPDEYPLASTRRCDYISCWNDKYKRGRSTSYLAMAARRKGIALVLPGSFWLRRQGRSKMKRAWIYARTSFCSMK